MTTALETARAELAAAELANQRAQENLRALGPNIRATDAGNAYANRVLNESFRAFDAMKRAEWWLYEAETATR